MFKARYMILGDYLDANFAARDNGTWVFSATGVESRRRIYRVTKCRKRVVGGVTKFGKNHEIKRALKKAR